MKTFLKSQLVSIFFGVSWILYLNLIAFLNHPSRAIMYIDWFVWGIPLFLTLIFIFIVKNYLGRKWVALPLVFFPYLLIYQPLFIRIQTALGFGSEGHREVIQFFSILTGTAMITSVLLALLIGILMAKK